jgi:hypothetical protein
MRNSSAQQLELDYGTATPRDSTLRIESAVDTGSPSTSTLGFGRFTGVYSTAEYAQNARLAARALAARIPESEYRALLDERQRLLDRKLAGDITKEELNRLEYVRWSLDRVEDAKYGAMLDVLETHAMRYEQFAEEVRAFHEELREAAETKDDSRQKRQHKR